MVLNFVKIIRKKSLTEIPKLKVNVKIMNVTEYLINHFSQNQFVGVKNATLIKTCHDLDDFLELPPGVSNSEIELIRTQINNYESNLRIEFPHIKIKEIFGPNLSINRLLLRQLNHN